MVDLIAMMYAMVSSVNSYLAKKSLIKPSLEYACSPWDPCKKGEINQLEIVQCRTARFVTIKTSKHIKCWWNISTLEANSFIGFCADVLKMVFPF
jgi:hypothetical protein